MWYAENSWEGRNVFRRKVAESNPVPPANSLSPREQFGKNPVGVFEQHPHSIIGGADAEAVTLTSLYLHQKATILQSQYRPVVCPPPVDATLDQQHPVFLRDVARQWAGRITSANETLKLPLIVGPGLSSILLFLLEEDGKVDDSLRAWDGKPLDESVAGYRQRYRDLIVLHSKHHTPSSLLALEHPKNPLVNVPPLPELEKLTEEVLTSITSLLLHPLYPLLPVAFPSPEKTVFDTCLVELSEKVGSFSDPHVARHPEDVYAAVTALTPLLDVNLERLEQWEFAENSSDAMETLQNIDLSHVAAVAAAGTAGTAEEQSRSAQFFRKYSTYLHAKQHDGSTEYNADIIAKLGGDLLKEAQWWARASNKELFASVGPVLNPELVARHASEQHTPLPQR